MATKALSQWNCRSLRHHVVHSTVNFITRETQKFLDCKTCPSFTKKDILKQEWQCPLDHQKDTYLHKPRSLVGFFNRSSSKSIARSKFMPLAQQKNQTASGFFVSRLHIGSLDGHFYGLKWPLPPPCHQVRLVDLSCLAVSFLDVSYIDLSCLAVAFLDLSWLAVYCLYLSCLAVACLYLSCLDLSCLAVSCLDLSYLDVSCLDLSCLNLSCLHLSRLDLSCLDISCLN